jgi:hypothetical protein
MCRSLGVVIVFVASGVAAALAQPDSPKDSSLGLRFRIEELDKSLKVGYAVITADVDGDGKLDIVVVDTNEVVWYQNPTWTKRTIIKDQTKDDNVCIAAADIDGDGKIDFALGADWRRGFQTREGGTIQWLQRGASLDQPWTVHPIGEIPTVHRMRFVDLDGDGKQHLVVAPLMGRGATRDGNWCDGDPVRILAYPIPADPVRGPWKPRVLAESLHVVHGIAPMPAEKRPGFDILAASYDGVSLIQPRGAVDGPWAARQIGAGNQESLRESRGTSEIKPGKLRSGKAFLAAIEPWHGGQVVVYTPPDNPEKLWDRQVIDSRLRWGHAVWCADLDGDGGDEIVVGVRDDPRGSDIFPDRRGVRVYRFAEDSRRWYRQVMDDEGKVAVEDLTCADLNGDGRIDIIAVGRQTGNLRVYWNER